jgi:hypothetical protein
LLIVIGLGEGHLLDELEARASTTKVLAIEPDPEMARVFNARRKWSSWTSSGRLSYLVAPGYAGADDAWRMFPSSPDACTLMLNPALTTNHPETGAAARVAQQILVGVRANAEARRRFAPGYLTNVIRNVASILRGRDVRDLEAAFAGVPAVVAAAGPSLDRNVRELAALRDRALLIAVDTALRPLLAHGIVPDFVVGLDPSEVNARHFQCLPEAKGTWLVAESALHRHAVDPFDGRTFWFRVSNHQPWPWLKEAGLDVGQIDVWGSVLTGAFQTACLAGCDPVVIVGADLAFTGQRPYCRGTTYEFDWAYGEASGSSREQLWRTHVANSPPKKVPDLHGAETTSTPSLISVRDWLVARARRSGHRVLNATGDGILFGDGIEQATLTEALALRGERPSLPPCRQKNSGADASLIRNRIAEIRASLASETEVKPLPQWREFCGGALDVRALHDALDDASHALERTCSPSPIAPPTDSSPPQTYLQLPELTARLRSALRGEVMPVAHGVVSSLERARILVDALALLGRVLDGMREDEPVDHSDPGVDLPASASFLWRSQGVRWAIELFEASLGRAWGSSEPAAASQRYFAGPVNPRLAEEATDTPANVVRPIVTSARLRLVMEWLRCASSIASKEGASLRETVERLRVIESIAQGDVASDGVGRATLLVSAKNGDVSANVTVPLGVSEAALARALSGCMRDPGVRETTLASFRSAGLDVHLAVTTGDCASDGNETDIRARRTSRFRWITGLGQSVISYPIANGIVCVTPHSTSSVVVDADGRVEPHLEWPRPIVGELPFGNGGAVAWGHGDAKDPERAPSYVMYRRTSTDDPTIENLPFKPLIGVWWDERVYWAYFAADNVSSRGIASWAPGAPARIDLPDVAVHEMRPEGSWLVLEPRARRANNIPERRLLRQGWRWQRSGKLVTFELGPHGAASGRSCAHGWVATTFPEADLVQLTRDDGLTLLMTVYQPMRAEWVGHSLLVSSAQNGMLLFERFVDELAAAENHTSSRRASDTSTGPATPPTGLSPQNSK